VDLQCGFLISNIKTSPLGAGIARWHLMLVRSRLGSSTGSVPGGRVHPLTSAETPIVIFQKSCRFFET